MTDATNEQHHIRPAKDFKPNEHPRVALHLLVGNDSAAVARLLANVGPYLSEVVIVFDRTTDDTRDVVSRFVASQNIRFLSVDVDPESNPGLYILDVVETYMLGRSLIGEGFGGPFTGKHILADFARAKNLGWELGEAEWKLCLNVGDEIYDPKSLWGVCELLEEVRADSGRTLHTQGAAASKRYGVFRTTLARRSEDIRWVYPSHEVVHGAIRSAIVEGNLTVVDAVGVAAVPGHDFKISYHFARANDWAVNHRVLLRLASDAHNMPALARAAALLCLKGDTSQSEAAEAHIIVGKTYEAEEDWASASGHYMSALRIDGDAEPAWHLCRSRYHEGQWDECVRAYETALERSKKDSGQGNVAPIMLEMHADASKVLYGDSLAKLGRWGQALQALNEILAKKPTSLVLRELRDSIAAASAAEAGAK